MPEDDVKTEVEETSADTSTAETEEPTFATVEMSDMTVAEHAKWLTTGNLPDRFTPKEQKSKTDKPEPAHVRAAKAREKAEAEAKAKEDKSATSAQSSDTDEDETETASETDATTDKEKKDSEPKESAQPDRAEKRKAQLSQEIVTLLNQSKDAKRELADLQKQIADSKSGTATTTKPEKDTKPAADRPTKPLWKTFDAAGKTWDEYEDARDKYQDDILAYERKETERIIRETVEAERKEQQKTQTAAQITEQNQKTEETVKKRIAAVQKRLGDKFDASVYFGLKVNPTTDAYLLKIDEGAEVWNYLATHPEEAEDIRELDAFETMERLAPLRKQIQDELKPKDKKPVVPRATHPPSDVGGKNAAPTDELEAAMEQGDAGFRRYMKEANRREAEARKANAR